MRPAGRDGALDALRGVAVAGMALVNLQDPFRPAFGWLTHAAWNGLTPADLVFPVFVLSVGLSTPLALDRAGAPGAGRIALRAAVLVSWGLVLNWLLHPVAHVWTVRASGVLQRIGVVYLACALLAGRWKGWRAPAAAAAVLMLLHAGLLLLTPAPGEAAPSLEAGRGLSGWLDRHVLPGRIPRAGYDPEGVLSTLSAVAQGLLGVAAMRAWRRGSAAGPLAGGLALVIAGCGCVLVMPVNKQLWTPAFALITSGLGLAIWAGLRALGGWRELRGAAFLGRTALTFYVVHTLLIALLLQRLGGVRLWSRAADAARIGAIGPEAANLIAALAMAGACVAATAALAKRGWTLRA